MISICCQSLPFFRKICERILPYKGDREYQYYLDGLKVNGKRKRIFFKTEKAAIEELKKRRKQIRKEGEEGAAISADLRVLAAKAEKLLAPYGNLYGMLSSTTLRFWNHGKASCRYQFLPLSIRRPRSETSFRRHILRTLSSG
jgi:hypothetical protein